MRSRDRVARGFERVAEREPRGANANVDVPAVAQERGETGSVVATVVADDAIVCAEAGGAGGHAEGEETAGANSAAPLEERGTVVLDVLEHLERADDVVFAADLRRRRLENA